MLCNHMSLDHSLGNVGCLPKWMKIFIYLERKHLIFWELGKIVAGQKHNNCCLIQNYLPFPTEMFELIILFTNVIHCEIS